MHQKLTFTCPNCKKEQTVDLTIQEIKTFEVKCPSCGITVLLNDIKGFKQFKIGPADRRLSRLLQRDARKRSDN